MPWAINLEHGPISNMGGRGGEGTEEEGEIITVWERPGRIDQREITGMQT